MIVPVWFTGKMRKQAACMKAMRSRLQEREANVKQHTEAFKQSQAQLAFRYTHHLTFSKWLLRPILQLLMINYCVLCRERELAAASAALEALKADCKQHVAMKGHLMQQLQVREPICTAATYCACAYITASLRLTVLSARCAEKQ